MRTTQLGLAFLLVVGLGACVESGQRTGNNNDGGGNGGNDLSAGEDFSTGGESDLSVPITTIDLVGKEAGTAYDDAGMVDPDANGCGMGETAAVCAMPIAAGAGCMLVEDCVLGGGSGNGEDDDCNGIVDDGCSCVPGEVKKCFLGPPGKRNVGACTDGTMTCFGGEFGSWGDCVGSIGPSAETCDGLDNDCNGCADDGLCCGDNGVKCPAPGDPNIAPVTPYSTLTYDGAQFFSGTAKSWTWTVEGGPCDRLFASSSFTPVSNPPKQSFTVTNGTTEDPSIYFSLSGDYTVTMTVVDDTDKSYTCKWVQPVFGPGVRFELCWDHQGTAAQGGADLDLHVHKSGTTSDWFIAPGTGSTDVGACSGPKKKCKFGATCNASNRCILTGYGINPDDCFFANCTARQYTMPMAGVSDPDWYPDSTPATNCQGNTKYGADWATLGYCHNPRLDLDNINDVGVPENTNIDNPANNDKFRAMVHYYGQDNLESTTDVEQHPIVNVYCGGSLKASYGQTPNQLTGFSHGTAQATGQMWRVADVTAVVDGAGNTTDCNITPLHAPSTTSGYWVTPSTNTARTY